MCLTPAEKKEYLQGKTDDDKKSQLKEISRKRGVPFGAGVDAIYTYLTESVMNRDAWAMALGWRRVMFDLKEPQSPYKLARKELLEAQAAYSVAADEFHTAELKGLEDGRTSDQDCREAKIAKNKADARVKRARRAVEIASKDKNKKVWMTVANCKETQKTTDIIHYGDYVSPIVKIMGLRSYSSASASTFVYLTPTILHIASRPEIDVVLPDMIEGAHAVDESSEDDDLMEEALDEEEEEDENAEDGDSAAEDDSDIDLPDIA